MHPAAQHRGSHRCHFKEFTMFHVSASTLRRVLWLDAAAGLGMGLSHLALTDWLSGLTGLPVTWLQVAVVVVFGAVALSSWLASRVETPMGGVRVLAVANFAWVAASLWVAFGAGLALTPLGLGWVLLQALFVFVLAELEWAGASRSARLATA